MYIYMTTFIEEGKNERIQGHTKYQAQNRQPQLEKGALAKQNGVYRILQKIFRNGSPKET